MKIPVHTLGFKKKGEPAEDTFARRVGGLPNVVVPPDWIRSIGLLDHPRHGRVVAAHQARRIRDDVSPALEFYISLQTRASEDWRWRWRRCSGSGRWRRRGDGVAVTVGNGINIAMEAVDDNIGG
ncbi:hypothetical protein QJS10_CPA16g00624 [Acorus calamus]|uniref:Uncharacterized protein n=1 Tax=Acorus calamus TaxID=4465 RepID=A0AAV9CZ43_ACOCL|nr:hypothetical protein QJS10_CPA16g00624 [Acorus calamus]